MTMELTYGGLTKEKNHLLRVKNSCQMQAMQEWHTATYWTYLSTQSKRLIKVLVMQFESSVTPYPTPKMTS